MTIHAAPPWLTQDAHQRNAVGTSFTGAVSEIIACAELMRLGFYVYRCESPAAPFDLVAYRAGQCLRVEVKSVTPTPNAPQFGYPKNDEWDLLAVVGENADVFLFEPSMSRLEMRNVIRAHHGLPPAVEPVESPCGTVGAYQRHKRREESCMLCSAAMRDYRDGRRAITAAR